MLNKIIKIWKLIKFRINNPDIYIFGLPNDLSIFKFKKREIKRGFYSQLGQDELIFTEFFNYINLVSFPKIFIDIGANHPIKHSNSYFFECNQGFSVLAIDPLKEVNVLWETMRPNVEFVLTAVGEINGEIEFNVVEGGEIESMFSSVSGASNKNKNYSSSVRTVPIRRLENTFAEHKVSTVGIVSLDIEGYELNALKGIDFNTFKSYIFLIENNSNLGIGDNEIRKYMTDRGYLYYARLWNLDDIFIHKDIFLLK